MMKKCACGLLLLLSLAACAPHGNAVRATPDVSVSPLSQETPAPAATDQPPILTPTPAMEAEQPMMVFANALNLRQEAQKDGTILTELVFGQQVWAGAERNGFTFIRTEDGLSGYCSTEYLCAPDTQLAALPKSSEADGKLDNLVDVRQAVPDADIYMIFAIQENFIGRTLYPRDLCLLQQGTAERLKQANEKFMQDGYRIKVYDAYRPLSVQRILYERIGNASYIADPDKNASNHNRGAAVDITLVDMDGNELQMPTPMHTFDETANRDYTGWTQEASDNVAYMTDVMTSCGFLTIRSEWWHFSDKEQSKYMTTDLDFSTVPMRPVSAGSLY